jgi:hypothetical protein
MHPFDVLRINQITVHLRVGKIVKSAIITMINNFANLHYIGYEELSKRLSGGWWHHIF